MRRGIALVLLMILMALSPMATTTAQGTGDSIIINEILVSPNNANYGGTDWNGDG